MFALTRLVTQATSSYQGWMSFLKLVLVCGIAGGQIFVVTQHFAKGKPRTAEINPFASTVI